MRAERSRGCHPQGGRWTDKALLGISLQLIDYIIFARIVVNVNLGVAYAIFAGGAILGSFILGAIMFKERLTPIGYVSAAMIVFGIVLIHAFGTL